MNRRQFQCALAGLAGLGPLAACSTIKPPTAMNAIDSHTHVFLRTLPMPDRRRAPSGYDATPEQLLALFDASAITHGVIVQPSFLGTDNSYLLDVLRRHPQRLRGIAVIQPGIADEQLDALLQAGVAGIRLNQVGLAAPNFGDPAWRRLLPRLQQRGMQVEVHQLARELPPLLAPLLDAGINVVVDHFGRPDPALGVDDPGFRHLLAQGASRRLWVKLSGAYRNGAGGRGEAVARQALPLLRAHLGTDRLMWGSDWPHTLFETATSHARQRALLNEWLPDDGERQRALWDTPAALFGFTQRLA
ncbi:amidohydrolase family protein [Rugamonas sp. A1-17]|nr:amidohydrolase family protein [Rugamonas sp. A1-17]